jgi:hypothetical protein
MKLSPTTNRRTRGGQSSKAAFTTPPTGQQGDFRRNVLRGFGAWQADFAVQRQFHFTGRMGLRFRAEFFNIFNHPNFGQPDNILSDPPLRPIDADASQLPRLRRRQWRLQPLYQIGGPRSIQLALKLQF